MGLNIQSVKTSGNWGYLIKRPSGWQGVKAVIVTYESYVCGEIFCHLQNLKFHYWFKKTISEVFPQPALVCICECVCVYVCGVCVCECTCMHAGGWVGACAHTSVFHNVPVWQ